MFHSKPSHCCCMLSSGWFASVWNLYANVSQHSVPDWTTTLRQTGHLTTLYIDLYFHVTQTDPEPPWRWQTTSKHVGARIYNKAVVQICALCWLFLLRLIMHSTNINSVPSSYACEDGQSVLKRLAYELQTSANHPEESKLHSEHGKSLKSSIISLLHVLSLTDLQVRVNFAIILSNVRWTFYLMLCSLLAGHIVCHCLHNCQEKRQEHYEINSIEEFNVYSVTWKCYSHLYSVQFIKCVGSWQKRAEHLPI
jgi:cytochrome c oxidase subunit IV